MSEIVWRRSSARPSSAVIERGGSLCYDPPRMQAPSESGPSTPFQEWLDRLARPIEFASRDECAHLGAVKNLSSFVSTQVLTALAQQVYPRAIESRLVSLRDLFVDFQPTLSVEEQRRRLQVACSLVQALRKAAVSSAHAWGDADRKSVV